MREVFDRIIRPSMEKFEVMGKVGNHQRFLSR